MTTLKQIDVELQRRRDMEMVNGWLLAHENDRSPAVTITSAAIHNALANPDPVVGADRAAALIFRHDQLEGLLQAFHAGHK